MYKLALSCTGFAYSKLAFVNNLRLFLFLLDIVQYLIKIEKALNYSQMLILNMQNLYKIMLVCTY